jgi:hypothetical protein
MWTGNHSHEELAKFGYRSERKVDNFQNPTMFWQPLGTYCLNMATFEKQFPQNVATWAYFSKKNPLYPFAFGFFFPK